MSETPAPPEGIAYLDWVLCSPGLVPHASKCRAELTALRAELVNCERNEEKAMNHADLMTELADTYEGERDIARAELDAVKGERDRKEQIALDAEWERDSEIECADKKVDALRARLAAAKRMADAAITDNGATTHCLLCDTRVRNDDPDPALHRERCPFVGDIRAALRAFRETT